MAVTDDIPDDNVQQPAPLSPQIFSICPFTLPVAEQCASNSSGVNSQQLLNHTSYSDDHYAAAAAAEKSPLYTSDSASVKSCQTMCQTDSLAPDEPHVSSHNNSAVASSCQSNAVSVKAVSSSCAYGRDALMNSEPVLHALEMGFDYEAIRYVVHLKMVQSGESYMTSSDLVEAVLAYVVAIADVASDDGDSQYQQPQQLQQQQQVKPAETTTNSSSQQQNHHHHQCVGFDVTDASSSAAAAAVSAADRKPPGKKRKPRRNKNTTSSRSSKVNQSQTEAGLHDSKLDAQCTQLPVSSLDRGGCMERLPWEIERENKQLRAAKTCKICLEADVSVVFIPCGHVVCCHGCASFVSRCSLCETSVADTVKIYMN